MENKGDFVPKILVFAGSTRKESYNKRLVKIAGEGARKAGAHVTFLDLRDIPLPLYDEDLEEQAGLPAHAKNCPGEALGGADRLAHRRLLRRVPLPRISTDAV